MRLQRVFILTFCSFLLFACQGVRVSDPQGGQSNGIIYVRPGELHKDYKIALVSFYITNNRLNFNMRGTPYLQSMGLFKDTLNERAQEIIQQFNSSSHFTLISGPEVTQNSYYLEQKELPSLYLLHSLPEYKRFSFSNNDQLSELAQALNVDAVMVITFSPNTFDIKDGRTILNDVLIKAVNTKSETVFNTVSLIQTMPNLYMQKPYTKEKFQALLLETFNIAFRIMHYQIDKIYEG